MTPDTRDCIAVRGVSLKTLHRQYSHGGWRMIQELKVSAADDGDGLKNLVYLFFFNWMTNGCANAV
ncbi:uncharacterized protein BO96DRAFT_168391 [Aspergillus niger CBS 101883]|uniref:uncharacterized protein n=1 Tax=Aspergillus lacticoffeatus (strain CBS 101883) TaxID=1450533 RepID=UPI000D8006D7|nr:uncharacterized protein BO96DRAFT_168391 [Aspergillus niger CBS 101883]PYH52114.1 hypothetical protein BO96DRAFT_168391 [Aspergillus niger CBS 101883]